jgi:hypothetical protein
MGTKEMDEQELQMHWQDRQREREREAVQHEGARNRTSSSSNRPDFGVSKRSDATAFPCPSPPHSRGSNANNTLSSRFGDDTHRSNRSQTKCGSETESENEQEYDRALSTPGKQGRGDRIESTRPLVYSAEDSAGVSGAILRGHSAASTDSGPKGWPTASKKIQLTVAVPTLCSEEPTFAPARRRSSSLLLQERQLLDQGQGAAPDGSPSTTPKDREYSLSSGPQEGTGTDPEDLTPLPSPRASNSNSWKSARASNSHRENRPSASSLIGASAADSAADHERNRSPGPPSSSSRAAAASPSAPQRDLSYAGSVNRKKSEDYGDVEIHGSSREDIHLSSGGHQRQSPEKGTRHKSGGTGPNRRADVVDGVQYRGDGSTRDRSDNRTDGRIDCRSDNRTDGRSDNRSDNRTDGRIDCRSDYRSDKRSDDKTDGRSDNRSDGRPDNRTNNTQGEVHGSRSSPINVTVYRSPSKPLPAEPLLSDSANAVPNKVVSEVVKIEGTLSQRHYERNMNALAPQITDSTRKLRDRGSDRERGRDHSGRGHSLEREREQLPSQHQDLDMDVQSVKVSNHRHAAHSRREAADEELERMEAILDGLLDANKGLEKELGDSKQKILQLESEALVRAMEREESATLSKSKQDLWAVQLVAQTSRAMSLEEENNRLKEVAEGMKIRDTVNHTKISSLSGEKKRESRTLPKMHLL